jgi:hypothetical protein
MALADKPRQQTSLIGPGNKPQAKCPGNRPGKTSGKSIYNLHLEIAPGSWEIVIDPKGEDARKERFS